VHGQHINHPWRNFEASHQGGGGFLSGTPFLAFLWTLRFLVPRLTARFEVFFFVLLFDFLVAIRSSLAD
jgi:hypothetical protein